MREERTLQKLCSRDPEGLRALMDRYIPYVSTIVWNILRGAMTPQDSEEVVSDVFMAAWDQADQLQAGKVKAWLGAVARNKAKNKLRQMGQTLPLEEDVLELEDNTYEQFELQELIRSAVDSLSPKDREIFLRHYYYAQTVEEISQQMKMKPATVKTRLRRGRLKLKEFLTGGNEDETQYF